MAYSKWYMWDIMMQYVVQSKLYMWDIMMWFYPKAAQLSSLNILVSYHYVWCYPKAAELSCLGVPISYHMTFYYQTNDICKISWCTPGCYSKNSWVIFSWHPNIIWWQSVTKQKGTCEMIWCSVIVCDVHDVFPNKWYMWDFMMHPVVLVPKQMSYLLLASQHHSRLHAF